MNKKGSPSKPKMATRIVEPLVETSDIMTTRRTRVEVVLECYRLANEIRGQKQ